MRHINKKLAVTAAVAALTAVLGVAVAQTPDDEQGPMTAPQQVDVTGSSGQHIYFFRDQGNAPETDPAAHLLLIKHGEMHPMPVAETTSTTTTTVAEATTPPVDTSPAPAAVDTTPVPATDTTAMPADTTPPLAPKADRN